MKIGMTLPVSEPGWTRELLLQWVRKIEAGPYSSLAFGERIFFPTPDALSLLSACAVLTERVKLVSTVMILPIHKPILLAKQLATIDVLSGGRLVVGVGTGGRDEDYLATAADSSNKRIAILASHVDTMRAVWRGERLVEGAIRPVEPLPLQSGGPPMLAGVMGPRSVASAATWADGISGMSTTARVSEVEQAMKSVNAAWSSAGHKDTPHFHTSFWFALGGSADEQIRLHLDRYLNWLEPDARLAMASNAGFRGSAEQLRERIRAFADTGLEELILIPTSIDPNEVDKVTAVIQGL